jgi:hypothetical protein
LAGREVRSRRRPDPRQRSTFLCPLKRARWTNFWKDSVAARAGPAACAGHWPGRAAEAAHEMGTTRSLQAKSGRWPAARVTVNCSVEGPRAGMRRAWARGPIQWRPGRVASLGHRHPNRGIIPAPSKLIVLRGVGGTPRPQRVETAATTPARRQVRTQDPRLLLPAPVLHGQDGMITERDICMAAATTHRSAAEICMSAVVSGPLHAARADDDAKEALRVMREAQGVARAGRRLRGALQRVLSTMTSPPCRGEDRKGFAPGHGGHGYTQADLSASCPEHPRTCLSPDRLGPRDARRTKPTW